jgi:hypothetical protein
LFLELTISIYEGEKSTIFVFYIVYKIKIFQIAIIKKHINTSALYCRKLQLASKKKHSHGIKKEDSVDKELVRSNLLNSSKMV